MALFLMGLVNYPHFLTNVHAYSNTFAGALVGILAVSNLAAVFPLGLLSDRVSPKKLYGGSLGCVILFYALFPLCTGKVLLVILFVVGGIGFAALRIFLRVLYYKYLPDSQRSKNISVFFSAGFLGFAAGGLAGGYMQDLGSMLSVPALPFFAAAEIGRAHV